MLNVRPCLFTGLLLVMASHRTALAMESQKTGEAVEPPKAPQTALAPRQPKVGEKAPDFSLQSLRDQTIKLAKLTAKGPVVLVVLRGYPGYQCPICSRQVGQLLQVADKLASGGAEVVLVYPGPSGQLKERAKEFYADQTIPKHFHLLIDPDYVFIKAYDLRWDAPRETAYPSTFVVDKKGIVRFAQVSKSHGGRSDAKTVLKALAELEETADGR